MDCNYSQVRFDNEYTIFESQTYEIDTYKNYRTFVEKNYIIIK